MKSESLIERIKYSPFCRVVTLPMRIRNGFSPLLTQMGRILSWLIHSREWANYSYNYDPIGLYSIAAAIGNCCNVPAEKVRSYASELINDEIFAERYQQRVTSSRLRYISDPQLCFGKCLLNYMLVRASGALIVFEAGTERGISSLAICRALQKNSGNSAYAQLITVDISADRGEFLEGDEGGLVTRIYGDSVEAILQSTMPIDFFIHDTINDSLHNQRQFAAVASKLAENAVVHCGWFNAEFISFCESRGLRYQEVAERPLNHWYAGRRCGLATLR